MSTGIRDAAPSPPPPAMPVWSKWSAHDLAGVSRLAVQGPEAQERPFECTGDLQREKHPSWPFPPLLLPGSLFSLFRSDLHRGGGLFLETLWNTEAMRLLLRGTGKRVGMWASRVQYQPGRSPPSASSLFRQPDPEPHRPQQDPLSEQLPAEYQQPAQWGARRPGQPQHPAATALHLCARAAPHPGLQEHPSSLPPFPGPGLSLIPGSVHVCPVELGPGAGPQALFLCGSDRGRLPGGKVAQVLSK